MQATKLEMKLVVGCILSVLVGFLVVLGKLFEYSLYSLTGKDIPWYCDVVCGFLLNGLGVVIAVVCWVVRHCGVEPPFFFN
jgi:hypothetical protein